MANQKMKESWARMKSDIRTTWNIELSDDELKSGRKNLNRMIDVIESNTDESRGMIRNKLIALI